MAADPDPTAPVRVEGPTPGGGAYALKYEHPDGTIEIVEHAEDGRELLRTYGRTRSKHLDSQGQP